MSSSEVWGRQGLEIREAGGGWGGRVLTEWCCDWVGVLLWVAGGQDRTAYLFLYLLYCVLLHMFGEWSRLFKLTCQDAQLQISALQVPWFFFLSLCWSQNPIEQAPNHTLLLLDFLCFLPCSCLSMSLLWWNLSWDFDFLLLSTTPVPRFRKIASLERPVITENSPTCLLCFSPRFEVFVVSAFCVG